MLWPRPRSWLAGAALAAAAGSAVFGGLHAYTHADAIVPVLVSLQRWTPFYWDQERYGMFVPLVALPVRDPLWNLLLQRFLLVAGGLTAVVLLARHVLPERDWRLAGLLSAASLLALAPGPWLFEFLADQPYGLSLGLALVGLAFAEPVSPGASPRPAEQSSSGPHPGFGERGKHGAAQVGLGAAVVLLAHWVNAAVGLLLLPLAVARALVDKAEKEMLPAPYRSGIRDRLRVDAGLLALGVAAAQVGIRLYPVASGRAPQLPLGFLPAAEWPAAWTTLAADAWAIGAGWAGVLAAAAALGVGLLAGVPHLRPALPRLLLRSGALLAAALTYALLAGTLRWVAANGFHWRYLAPSVVLVHVAAISLLAEPLARSRRLGPAAGRIALALPLLGALAAFGTPSLARVRADLDRTTGTLTAALLATGCDAVAGDYWTVWPAVWHVAWVRRERGDPAVTYGLAHRAGPTLSLWRRPGARVCVPAGEEAAAGRWLHDLGMEGEVTTVALPRAGTAEAPWLDVHRAPRVP